MRYLCIGELAMQIIVSKESFRKYHQDCGGHISRPNFWLWLRGRAILSVEGARHPRPEVSVPEVLCKS